MHNNREVIVVDTIHKSTNSRVWAGRVAALAAIVSLVVWMYRSGLTRASAFGGAAGLIVALVSLAAPYLLPATHKTNSSSEVIVVSSGDASDSAGGIANSGIVQNANSSAPQLLSSGDATADGKSSFANSGILNYQADREDRR